MADTSRMQKSGFGIAIDAEGYYITPVFDKTRRRHLGQAVSHPGELLEGVIV
jgi:hypothetical protein